MKFGDLGQMLLDMIEYRSDKIFNLVECDDVDVLVRAIDTHVSHLERIKKFDNIALNEVKVIFAQCAEILMRHLPNMDIESEPGMICEFGVWYHSNKPVSQVFDFPDGHSLTITSVKAKMDDGQGSMHFIDMNGYAHTVRPGWIATSEVPYVPLDR